MPVPTDTHPDAERIQIGLLREAGIARRLELTFDMTQSALDLSDCALRRRHPDLSEQELQLLTVALRYGDDLANAVRTHPGASRTKGGA